MDTQDKKQEKKPEEPKDWLTIASEFIKNPLVTGAGGAIAGYLLGKQMAKTEINEIKQEYKLQMQQRDEQFNKLIDKMTETNKLLANSLNGGPDKNKRFELEEVSENTFSYKPYRKYLKL